MNKLKPLLPSLREKKRYVAFEILDNVGSSYGFDTISDQIKASFLSMFGSIGLGKSGLWMLKDKWDGKMKKGIIKINHQYVNALKASLTMVTTIKGEQVMIRSLGTSGNLGKAERYIAA